MNPLPVVFVVGPTGSGKSKLAIELALRLQHSLTAPFPAEIINVDVMQMYQGLPIATNKAVRRGTPYEFRARDDPRPVKHHAAGPSTGCRPPAGAESPQPTARTAVVPAQAGTQP